MSEVKFGVGCHTLDITHVPLLEINSRMGRVSNFVSGMASIYKLHIYNLTPSSNIDTQRFNSIPCAPDKLNSPPNHTSYYHFGQTNPILRLTRANHANPHLGFISFVSNLPPKSRCGTLFGETLR